MPFIYTPSLYGFAGALIFLILALISLNAEPIDWLNTALWALLGAAFLLFAWSATSVATALLARRIPDRVSGTTQLAIGLTGVAIGQVLLLGISESSTWVRLLPGLLVAGVSSGVLNAALGREAVSSVPAGRAAMGSGANNTARYVGSALGVTVVAVLAGPVGTPTAAGLVEGWNSAVLFTAAASVVGALVVVVCSTRMVTPPAATPPGR